MTLHPTTFEYLKPTDDQLESMAYVRAAFAQFISHIDVHIPDGPDKDHVLRMLRDCAMWSNICITREPDGTPR